MSHVSDYFYYCIRLSYDVERDQLAIAKFLVTYCTLVYSI